jgi:2-(3-amino-3-carboxypropyl)histidine synthase
MQNLNKKAIPPQLKLLLSTYEIDLDEICKIVLEKGYTTIGLQLPEGLKIYAEVMKDYIADRVEHQGSEVNIIISGETCYGACDLLDPQFKQLGVQCIFHLGHTELPSQKKSDIPVIFISTPSKVSLNKVLKKFLTYLKENKLEYGSNPTIGLITTVQHINLLNDVQKYLTKSKLKSVIGKGDKRIKFDGQVLGCNFTSANSISSKIDLFLYIGSGNFHPLGVMLATGKKVIVADPYTNEIRDLEKVHNTILRQRSGAIARAMDTQTFGILISLKPGQNRTKLALEIQKLIKIHKKKSYLIAMDEFNPFKLKAFKVESLVSVGCPRVAIDDYLKYDVPILTHIELEIVLGDRTWDQYEFDQILAED